MAKFTHIVAKKKKKTVKDGIKHTYLTKAQTLLLPYLHTKRNLVTTN